jgi:lipopolysaccharide export LptBFGC system permease protein LptF
MKELRGNLDNWQPEERAEPSISWRRLIIPAACSVLSAAALVLLIGRLRSGGQVGRPFPTFSAG